MPKTLKIYVAFLAIVLITIVIVDANRPKPVNWNPTFNINDKIPFGLYVLDKEINTFFKETDIERYGVTPYEFFDPHYSFQDSIYDINGSALYINNLYEIDEESTNELLYFASHGNDVFISASSFPKNLRDSLKFDYGYVNSFNDTIQMYLKNTQKTYPFFKGVNDIFLKEYDSTSVEVLGYQKTKNQDSLANFIKVPYHKGNFYIHSQPVIFTNYNLLNKKNYKYSEKVLSFLNNTNIYWYLRETKNRIEHPMGYIFSQKSLNAAWKIGIIALFVFMFFNAKRKQRIVPIISPLKNTTVDFTKTIGNLYFLEGNHQDIMDKKIKFWLEKIRNDYHIDTFDLNETFINRLHNKTSKSKDEIEKVVRLIKKYRNTNDIKDRDLIEFNKSIEKLGI